MLELPESATIARQINEHLTGKIISEIKVLQTPHKFAFIKCEHEKYEECLEGQAITGAVFQGGMVQIDMEDSMIVMNDGAYPRYYDDVKKFPKNTSLRSALTTRQESSSPYRCMGVSSYFQRENAWTTITSLLAQSPTRSRTDLPIRIFGHCIRRPAKSCPQRRFSRHSSASPGLETACCRISCGTQVSIRAFLCRTHRRRISVHYMNPSIRS